MSIAHAHADSLLANTLLCTLLVMVAFTESLSIRHLAAHHR